MMELTSTGSGSNRLARYGIRACELDVNSIGRYPVFSLVSVKIPYARGTVCKLGTRGSVIHVHGHKIAL